MAKPLGKMSFWNNIKISFYLALLILDSVNSCNFYVEHPESITQEVLHSNKYGKQCVIYFPKSPFRRVNFTISFQQVENTSDRWLDDKLCQL